MAIKIKVLDGPADQEPKKALVLKIKIQDKEVEKVFLKARATIDGNIIISDHPEMDIFIMSKLSKIVSIPKDDLDDELHTSQKRLFKHLASQGVIVYDSIQAGNIFMSMEAKIPEAAGEGDKIEYVLYSLSKFIDKELPFYKDKEEFEKESEEQFLQPEPDEFTEFDPSRHQQNKGSLPPNMISYGINSIYRL
tara:strand:- start:25949 stop:26527 length:579 start_codon:yes stop_codon:yes gene_type:complete